MRCWKCVPMIMALCLLAGCGSTEETVDLRDQYHDMQGCSMEAVVSCDQDGLAWEATLHCEYVPGGESTVEVLAPETIAGVKAVLDEAEWRLEYEDDSLNAGTLSEEAISPAACLPRLMNALRDGWLLEENAENWNDVACIRIAVDQSGSQDGKIVSTVWLRQDDGTPLRGEIAVEGEIILTAEFTNFTFYDTMSDDAA
ncbi:MAG: hypothetical protein HFF84_11210 [Oscillibacter sp.]|nr:hypothetical protein [Oscillibacter sp.]